MILYPISYSLSDSQVVALSDAVQEVGETEMFILATEDSEPDVFSFPVGDVAGHDEAAIELPPLETIYFGRTGQWGLVTSHEDHAVLAGVPAVMEELARTFPPSEWNRQHTASCPGPHVPRGGADLALGNNGNAAVASGADAPRLWIGGSWDVAPSRVQAADDLTTYSTVATRGSRAIV